MQVDLWKCDSCGKEYRYGHGAGVVFHVDDELDPIDGDNFRVKKHADLCMTCAHGLLMELLGRLSCAHQADLAKSYHAHDPQILGAR